MSISASYGAFLSARVYMIPGQYIARFDWNDDVFVDQEHLILAKEFDRVRAGKVASNPRSVTLRIGASAAEQAQ